MDSFLALDIEDNRKASLPDKLAAALELMSLGIEMKRGSLARMYPQSSDEFIDERLAEWLIYYD